LNDNNVTVFALQNYRADEKHKFDRTLESPTLLSIFLLIVIATVQVIVAAASTNDVSQSMDANVSYGPS